MTRKYARADEIIPVKITYLPEDRKKDFFNIPRDIYIKEFILREGINGYASFPNTLKFDEENWFMKEVHPKQKKRKKKKRRNI
jgi:hypothetical protein